MSNGLSSCHEFCSSKTLKLCNGFTFRSEKFCFSASFALTVLFVVDSKAT